MIDNRIIRMIRLKQMLQRPCPPLLRSLHIMHLHRIQRDALRMAEERGEGREFEGREGEHGHCEEWSKSSGGGVSQVVVSD